MRARTVWSVLTVLAWLVGFLLVGRISRNQFHAGVREGYKRAAAGERAVRPCPTPAP